MSGFPECATQHQGPVLAGDALVKDGQVQNAFVYIKEGLGDRGFAVPTQPVVDRSEGLPLRAPRHRRAGRPGDRVP